ncbi:RL14-like protein [Mya arenaria]|uniref:Large ribosomal subunit protein eL14 n=1 Tax=Mya arenaria TaxID=6604 RepID=A0ABY7EQK7_MYAAR|nr:RL14-like protein [Mya arenaria]
MACGALGAGLAVAAPPPAILDSTVLSLGALNRAVNPWGGLNLNGVVPKLKLISAFCGNHTSLMPTDWSLDASSIYLALLQPYWTWCHAISAGLGSDTANHQGPSASQTRSVGWANRRLLSYHCQSLQPAITVEMSLIPAITLEMRVLYHCQSLQPTITLEMSFIPLPVSAACNYTGNESFILLPVTAACNYMGNESFIPLPVTAACNYTVEATDGHEVVGLQGRIVEATDGHEVVGLQGRIVEATDGHEVVGLQGRIVEATDGHEVVGLQGRIVEATDGHEVVGLQGRIVEATDGHEVVGLQGRLVEATDGHEVVGLQGRIVEATDGHEVVGLQGRIVEATDGHEVVGLQGRIVEATDGHEVVGLQGRISEGGTVYAETCGDPVPSTCPWLEQNEVGDGVVLPCHYTIQQMAACFDEMVLYIIISSKCLRWQINYFFCIVICILERCVEIGRVAYIAYGDDKGKLCVVLDIIDQNRVLVEGPCTNVARKEFNMKAIQMTQFLLKIPHSCRQKVVRKAWEKEEITKKANLTDFDRFKLMKAKQCRNRIVNTEFGKLRKAAKKGAKK